MRWNPFKKTEQRAVTSVPWVPYDVGGPAHQAGIGMERALSLVPMYGCTRIIADSVASLPLRAYRRVSDTRQPIGNPPLFNSPSVQGTMYDWLHRCVTSLALRGNAYGLITGRDALGYPTGIEWLHPDQVSCIDTSLSGAGSFANPLWYWNGRLVPAEDLVHIPWFVLPGRVRGLSPLTAAAATIGTGISAQDYSQSWFDQGAVPPGTFKNTQKTVPPDAAAEISDRLVRSLRGRKPLTFGNDWEYQPIAVSGYEAKFIETARLTATQIATIYGVPPERVGGEVASSMTYQNVEYAQILFVQQTLRPWLVRLESAFSALLPRGQYVKFGVDSMIRTDIKTRHDVYEIGRRIGLRSIDEIRALEDLDPLPGGQGASYDPLSPNGTTTPTSNPKGLA